MDDKHPTPPAEAEAALTDHEYDGIQEYDNPMPGWWVSIFWGSFLFAVAYFLWYHVYDKGSVAAAYAADMTLAREEQAARSLGGGVTEEALAGLAGNASVMADALGTFKLRCAPCHGQNGEGAIGPNLTDDHFIHGGGTFMDLHRVVDQGVVQKGMPAWGRQLSAIEVSKLAAYVGTLRGKNLPGKPPEGQKVGAPAPSAGTGG
ncbi:MAG: c-type cytochrome [Deltaproteobacteria bacterium]|nr:c-type cytochrome [Deltaproteobacteria bacterium]